VAFGTSFTSALTIWGVAAVGHGNECSNLSMALHRVLLAAVKQSGVPARLHDCFASEPNARTKWLDGALSRRVARTAVM